MKVPIAVLILSVSLGWVTGAAAQTYEEQVVEIVNQERWDNGQLPPLKGVTVLHDCAGNHSNDMGEQDFFGHCNPHTGTGPFDRMTAAGYDWNAAGENVAAGYSTPSSVMNGWMNSSGHRANILGSDFREIGVGYYYQGGDQSGLDLIDGYCNAYDQSGPFYNYWTQNFGRRSGVFPVIVNREAYSTGEREVALYVYGSGWAVEMRFQNEDGPWSPWEPYTADKTWTLSAGDGAKTVRAEIRNGSGTVKSAEDTIELSGSAVTAVIDGVAPVLQPAFPNPFRHSTTLRFSLDAAAPVRVEVVDVTGRRVATLQDGDLSAGIHESVWDGRDAAGRPAAGGVYFLRMRAGSVERVLKVVLKR